jgi:hypothetical protein
MTFEEILSRLDGVRRTNKTAAVAFCPAHSDANASLSIKKATDRLLLHCFANCLTENICAALDLKLSDLFVEPKIDAKREAAIYPYFDEHENLLFEVVRLEPKGFRQRRPNGRGGFIYKLDGVRRILFRLPELIKADKRRGVFICEGEKDVLRLNELGFIATCNSGGANKWRAEYGEFLRGRVCYILPDNDDAGRSHAEAVARSINGVAKEVRIVNLPDLPEKGDVSDFLKNHSAIDLKAAVAAAPIWKLNEAAIQPEKSLQPALDAEKLGFTYGELCRLALPEREEIIFGLGRGEIGLLNAVGNAGKTTLLRNLMVALCTARQFEPLGKFALARRVAFLDFEDSIAFLRRDLSVMLSCLPERERARFNDNALLICDVRDAHGEDLSLSNIVHLATLTNRLRRFAPDLIIVDTISSAFSLRDENNNAEVRQCIMRPLRGLAKDCGAALIAAHHIGKAKSEEGQTREASHKGRGASSFADMSRLVLNLERDGVNDTVILSCPKVKGQKFNDTVLRLDLEKRWFEITGERKEPSNFELLLDVFSDGLPHERAELDLELDGLMSKQTVTRLLSEAVKRGNLKKLGHGKYQNAQMLTPLRDEHLSISDKQLTINDLDGLTQNGNKHLQPSDETEKNCLNCDARVSSYLVVCPNCDESPAPF